MRLNPLMFVGFALFLFALYSFSQVGKVIHAPDSTDEKSLPLEQAAPEVVVHREAFRALVEQARTVEAACIRGETNGGEPLVRAKALIWDAVKEDVAEAHGKLPGDVRAQDADGPVTVFVISKKERHFIMDYVPDPFPYFGQGQVPNKQLLAKGYRTDVNLCVIDMPATKPRGWYYIYGYDPPSSVRLKPGQTEVADDDCAGPITKWVEGCVRGPQWRSTAWERVNFKGQEGYATLFLQARDQVPQCKAKGSLGPIETPLPGKALVWIYNTESTCSGLHSGHHALPKEQKASQIDTDVTVFLVIEDRYLRPHPGAGKELDTERNDVVIAAVAFPGAKPLGVFTVRGEVWPYDRPRNGNGIGPDQGKMVSTWVQNFLAKPESMLDPEAPPPIEPPAPVAKHAQPELPKADPPAPLPKPKGPVIINLGKPAAPQGGPTIINLGK